jgi:SAM-dependent methyltransferase
MSDFPGSLDYRCNICGAACRQFAGALRREAASCAGCGSTVRMRAMIHALSCALFGHGIALPDFPEAPGIKGIGMSDWDGYAVPLAKNLGYLNTYYHQEPRLDITNISGSDAGSVDFIISTDVFEHVCPPVSVAFENALAMLKPGGVFVFSVPYARSGETIEHFPDLHDFRIEDRHGKRVLLNRTREGIEQVFPDLVFHGGPGDTLEMRLFSESGLLRELADAGFRDVRIMRAPCFEFGIWHAADDSFPIIARREPAVLVIRDFGPQVLRRDCAMDPSASHTLWITYDCPTQLSGIGLTIGGLPVSAIVNGQGVTTGRIPESIYSHTGSYPIVIHQDNRAWPVGTLFVVD